MSWEEYNRHANFGPDAGQPQTLSGTLGQDAYHQAAERRRNLNAAPAGTYVPHAQTTAPRWMTHHAFKRGLFILIAAKLTPLVLIMVSGSARSDIVDFVSGVCALASIAGLLLMVCGVLNFFARRRNGGTA